MEYKEFLTKLGETALRYAELPEGPEEVAGVINEVEVKDGVGKTIDQTVQFDGNGDWSFSTSVYCPINIDATASINDAPSDASFDITIDTNYSQHFNFHDKHSGDSVSLTIKTNTFSKTKIAIKLHSSKPNISARLHLNCNI